MGQNAVFTGLRTGLKRKDIDTIFWDNQCKILFRKISPKLKFKSGQMHAGEEVELDEIPEPAKPYLDIPKKIKKDK